MSPDHWSKLTWDTVSAGGYDLFGPIGYLDRKRDRAYKQRVIVNGTYWKSARVLRKNNFNCTNVVDDVNGDIQIANLFKDKYERLFNSVQYSKEESELKKTQIDSEVVNVCNTTKTCESSNCVHCHLMSSTDVSTAVSKLNPIRSGLFQTANDPGGGGL